MHCLAIFCAIIFFVNAYPAKSEELGDPLFNRLSVSPNGSKIALWQRSRDPVMKSPGLSGNTAIAIVSTNTGRGLSQNLNANPDFVQWSKDGDEKLYIKTAYSAYVINSKLEVLESKKLPLAQTRIRWTPLTYLEPGQFDNYISLVSNLKSARSRIIASSGEHWLVGEASPISSDGLIVPPPNFPFELKWVYEPRNFWFEAGALGGPLSPNECMKSIGSGSRPIIEANSGEAIGCFSEVYSTVKIPPGSLQSGHVNPLFEKEGYIIQDGVANKSDIYLLLENYVGQFVYIIRADGEKTLLPLGGDDVSYGRAEGSASREFARIRHHKDGDLGFIAKIAGATDLQIHFRGGPLYNPLTDFGAHKSRLDWDEDRNEFFAFYPSTLGAGHIRAMGLSEDPRTAGQSYLKSLTQWIKKQPYKRIFIRGDSFGATFAINLAHRLRGQTSGVSLVVPLLHFKADTLIGGGSYDPHVSSDQIQFEDTAFGSGRANRRRVAQLILDARGLLCSQGRVSVFFGEKDHISPPIRNLGCDHDSVDVFMYHGRGHNSVTADPKFKKDLILNYLDGSEGNH